MVRQIQKVLGVHVATDGQLANEEQLVPSVQEPVQVEKEKQSHDPPGDQMVQASSSKTSTKGAAAGKRGLSKFASADVPEKGGKRRRMLQKVYEERRKAKKVAGSTDQGSEGPASVEMVEEPEPRTLREYMDHMLAGIDFFHRDCNDVIDELDLQCKKDETLGFAK